jgi:hypothetical protein
MNNKSEQNKLEQNNLEQPFENMPKITNSQLFVVQVLSKKFGFSEEEAISELTKNKKVIVLPFCVETDGCKALVNNHRLYTQCGKETEGDFCKGCLKKSKDGAFPFGTTSDRLKVDLDKYIDPSGKKVANYASVMKKLDLSREEVEQEALVNDITIPAIYFEETVVSKRGRPSKNIEIERGNDGDEVIRNIFKEVSAEISSSENNSSDEEQEKGKKSKPKKNSKGKTEVSKEANSDEEQVFEDEETSSSVKKKTKEGENSEGKKKKEKKSKEDAKNSEVTVDISKDEEQDNSEKKKEKKPKDDAKNSDEY